METAIRVDRAVTTLVNVFTVEPDNQPKMLALLEEGTQTTFSRMPGWISTSLLGAGTADRWLSIPNGGTAGISRPFARILG